MIIVKKLSDMIKRYWEEKRVSFEDSDGKVSIDSKHPTPKFDRSNAKKYNNVFSDTEVWGSTGGGSPQDPTKKNLWEPPDLD